MTAKRLAYTTTVAPERSRAEIDALLTKAGADEILIGHDARQIAAGFRLHGRRVRINRPLPPKPATPRATTATQKRERSGQFQADPWTAYDQEVRRQWRVLLRIIQVQLELIADEAVDVDDAFMPWLTLPDHSTVRDHVRPSVARAYETGEMPESMLPGLPPAAKVIALGSGK